MSGKQKEQQQQQQQQVPGYAVENDAERAEYLARQLAIAHQEKEAAVKEKDDAVIQLQILIRREKDVARREQDIQRQESRIAQQLQEMALKKACYHLCVYIVVVLSLYVEREHVLFFS